MTAERDYTRRLSRRDLLAAAAAAGLAGGVTAAALSSRPAVAQSALSPDQALERLMSGNARYVKGGLTAFTADLSILKQGTAEKQEPFASVLSCADSRVPVEIAFDQSIGHVFVCRVAGNIGTPEIIGSLEYGAAVLGTPVIMVLGHGRCGAVSAAIVNKAVPGQISSLFPHLRPAVDRTGPNLEAAIKANATIQADLLRTSSPVLAGLVKEGKLKIVAAYYELTTGRVSLL
ncbi:MAG TPA: carbonic anhydrase [bacterium]|nr:carbonic anhydrase [bacterium]